MYRLYGAPTPGVRPHLAGQRPVKYLASWSMEATQDVLCIGVKTAPYQYAKVPTVGWKYIARPASGSGETQGPRLSTAEVHPEDVRSNSNINMFEIESFGSIKSCEKYVVLAGYWKWCGVAKSRDFQIGCGGDTEDSGSVT